MPPKQAYKKPTEGIIEKLLVEEGSLVDTPANDWGWVEIRKRLEGTSMARKSTLEKILKTEFGVELEIQNTEDEKSTKSLEQTKEGMAAIEKNAELIVDELEKTEKSMRGPKLIALLENVVKFGSNILESASGKGGQQKQTGDKVMADATDEKTTKSESEVTLKDIFELQKKNASDIEEINKKIVEFTAKPAEENTQKNKDQEADATVEETTTKSEDPIIKGLESQVEILEKSLKEFENSESEKVTKRDNTIAALEAKVEDLKKRYDNIKKVREGGAALEEDESVKKSKVDEEIKKGQDTWSDSAIGSYVREVKR